MATTDIMRAVITGRLTEDPELRSLASGNGSVCKLRVASNGRRKDNATGEWEDDPNYFTVNVFGHYGETTARLGTKGRRVSIDGRLNWREWEAKDASKRQAVEIIGDTVVFLDHARDRAEEPPEDEQGPESAPADGDDIPF